MESHILNSYHQARYRSIGHKVMRSKSDSLSSESSCNHNSPEYTQIGSQPTAYVGRAQSEEESVEEDWCATQKINTTQSSHDTSSDEESSETQEDVDENIVIQEHSIEDDEDDSEYLDDSIVVQEVNVDDEESIEVAGEILVQDLNALEQNSNALRNMQLADANIEDNSLVEGHDYDVITVYTVNPDLDLIEVSSDDEQTDFDASEKEFDEREYLNHDDKYRYNNHVQQPTASDICQSGIDLNLDAPVVSNVDEYFIKDNKLILDADEPVVKDVDEYFIKDKGKESIDVPNVDDFFIKHKLPEEESTRFQIPEPILSVNELLKVEKPVKKDEHQESIISADKNTVEQTDTAVSINDSALEALPNIEELKRFLLGDMTYTKFKSVQRSCSLPQSPMQNLCMDMDDAKTCLSFEDLNLDLSDLAFDNDKDKSDSSGNKSDDVPRTLTEEDVNSFLITNRKETNEVKNEDDLSHQDMEIERPLESIIDEVPSTSHIPDRKLPSTPIPIPTVLDFCIEKTTAKKDTSTESKTELDDFVDVESCNDTVIPVLEANNLSSLLEQFEATEKLNTKRKRPNRTEEQKKSLNKNSLTNGMRLQDAGVQLNKNKMRQILMPSTVNTSIRRSPSPVHSDHDYCSSKKRHSLPNLKGGQSLLKPEVLSSNSRILNSRHRSCKNKKVVYHLSSDDESEKCNNNAKNKKMNNDSDIKKKGSVKQAVKPPAQSNCRKKLSPIRSVLNDECKDKGNNSVMMKSACKAGDTSCSQNSNGSIKLTIKNKSEVILNCDYKDSQKDKHIDKCKANSVSDNMNNVNLKQEKYIKELDRDKNKHVNSVENVCTDVVVKQEPRPKNEHFYTALFSNKQDVQIPQTIEVKAEEKPTKEGVDKVVDVAIKKEIEQPLKKKKLNLQEYKLRREATSNNSSATVSPEAIFPDLPSPLIIEKTAKCAVQHTPPTGTLNTTEKINFEAPKKFFDPIREASRKILMNNKKQKAEATRKRDEDIVMSKIPKVDNLELQPLISDAEMMKIVGMAKPEVLPIPTLNEKPQLPVDYEEIILVSVGTNTDDKIFKQLEVEIKYVENAKTKSISPPVDNKALINFRIKKCDHVLKQNVFDAIKKDKRNTDENKHTATKIDKERYKDITAALKSVEKQVDTKISSNSLFASIQDVVLKKAPDERTEKSTDGNKHSKTKSPVDNRETFKFVKPKIVREYDIKAEHGEDKVILHLGKHRSKPTMSNIIVQTDPLPKFVDISKKNISKEKSTISRKRNDSDMSMSSEDSPIRIHKDSKLKVEDKSLSKKDLKHEKRSLSKEKRSRSKERYEAKYRRRSRSLSRSRRRRRSHSRSRSRSRGRYRRYRRSDSPYKRKRRSRSPYHKRRSPSVRREHRSNRSRSRSRPPPPRSRSRSRPVPRSKSPMAKKMKLSPHTNGKANKSTTPPLRKLTVSESSESSSSSSSSSSSTSSSNASRKSRRSCSPYKREELYGKKVYRSFSSEDRESNTPVEERRIVFVGKLEKDITKATLRNQFSKFGPVMEVRLHTKEDGSRYGFVTYQRARDAWNAVEAANTFPHYDVGFGGRRAFCRQSYADLDGLEAKYTESAFHGQTAIPLRRSEDMSFEQMLLEMKKKLSQRKNDNKRPEENNP